MSPSERNSMRLDAYKERWNISIYNIGPLWCARFYPVAKLWNAVIPLHAEARDMVSLEDKVVAKIRETEKAAGVRHLE